MVFMQQWISIAQRKKLNQILTKSLLVGSIHSWFLVFSWDNKKIVEYHQTNRRGYICVSGFISATNMSVHHFL